jgi:hypothetical protein
VRQVVKTGPPCRKTNQRIQGGRGKRKISDSYDLTTEDGTEDGQTAPTRHSDVHTREENNAQGKTKQKQKGRKTLAAGTDNCDSQEVVGAEKGKTGAGRGRKKRQNAVEVCESTPADDHAGMATGQSKGAASKVSASVRGGKRKPTEGESEGAGKTHGEGKQADLVSACGVYICKCLCGVSCKCLCGVSL